MACCPFHNDKHPSMKVDRRFHCFGCQADGDVIDFTARLFGLSSKEAALKLAEDFSVSYDAKGHDPPRRRPVSYTHLDVYKRQCLRWHSKMS